MVSMQEYTSVKLPKDLAEAIDELIRHVPGYRNRTEWVIETLRLRLQRIEKMKKGGK